MPVAPDKTKQARIHPAIIAFIMSQPADVLNQDLDEENPHIVTDPRKWKIASDVLYATKNPHALKPAVGEEITAAFIDFVQSINLTVDDVVKGYYAPTAFAQLDVAHRLSTTLGLVTATEAELPVIRDFVGRYLGQENLAVFDSLWIRNDPERAAIIAEQNPEQTASQGVADEREL